MEKYIIGIVIAIVCIILLYTFYLSYFKYESFQNMNLISNGSFNEGKDLDSKVIKSDNFSIVEFPNPGTSGFVLRQDSFDTNKSYQLDLSLEKNKFYHFSYWRTNSIDYNGPNKDIAIFLGNIPINEQGRIVENRDVNGSKWTNIVYIFNSGENNILSVKIGNIGVFSKGNRMFTNFILKRHIPSLSNFDILDGLKALCLVDKQNLPVSNNQVNDLSNNGNYMMFKNPIVLDDNIVKLEKNTATIGSSKDIIAPKFTIIFTYKSAEYENGSLINISAINDINSGINVEFQNTSGVDNKLVITIGPNKYIYDIGISQKTLNYYILFDGINPQLYIDGYPVKYSNNVSLVTNKKLGTCPDGWKYMGDNKCQFLNVNQGTCAPLSTFGDNFNKEEWAKGCNTKWVNCKSLNSGEIAPLDNISCTINTALDYTDKPIMINKDSSLKGSLNNLIVYSRNLTIDEISKINNYLTRINYRLETGDVSKLPNIFVSDESPKLLEVKPEEVKSGQPKCRFLDKTICENIECKGVDWDNPTNISERCRNIINNYCRGNYTDNMCIELRSRKERTREMPKLVEKPGQPIAESVEKIAKCPTCKPQPDMSKYIRKDQIPCWGCNL